VQLRNYVIFSDSSCDLNKEKREKYNVEYIPMRILFDDKDYPASLDYEYVGYKEFFELMRSGVRIRTAQINVNEYVQRFEEVLSQGKDVLYISCSSSLSSSYKGSLVAKEELLKKYPDAKIEIVDSLNGCLVVGLITITASILREQGKSIEEVRDYLEEHKLEMNQFGSVDNLVYLKRAGRVSVASAFFGGLLQFKPIIISDINGMNTAIEKVKGRKKSFERLVDYFK
jgi:DegV family protein with EDD domain